MEKRERERDGLSTNNEESFWLDTNSYTQLNIHKRKGERVRERERERETLIKFM